MVGNDMSRFEDAIDVVLAHEGGYTIDDGGPTNYGWTLPALAAIGMPMTPEQLRGMSRDLAAKLYCRWYWNGFGAVVNQTVATKLLDMAVNMEGPRGVAAGEAVRLAQRAANSLALHNSVAMTLMIDGFWGTITCSAINALDPHAYLQALIAEQTKFYRGLAAANQKYAPYLAQWLARAAWPNNTAEVT